MIDKLQNYYGISIRRNVGKDVATMESAIWDGFFMYHLLRMASYTIIVPKAKTVGVDPKSDVANKTELFRHGDGLSDTVIKHIKPILVELRNDSLLYILYIFSFLFCSFHL